MNDLFWPVLLFALALDGLLTVTRAAMINTRPSSLNGMNGVEARRLERSLKILQHPRLRITLRLILNFLHIFIGVWSGAYFIGSLGLEDAFLPLAGFAALIAFLLLGVEHLLEGPVLRRHELWAVRLTPLAEILVTVLTPFTLLLAPLLGMQSVDRSFGAVTEDELRSWVESEEATGGLEAEERQMIASIFEFSDTLAREIMIPRVNVLALEVTTPIEEAIERVLTSGHSRLPVYEETIDNVVGILHAKDLLRALHQPGQSASITDYMRSPMFVPEGNKVDDLLRQMQARGNHMAIVVDEYGGMAGVVTLEDIVEEIVGDIRDEYDQSEERAFVQKSDDEFVFLGRIDIDDFNELTGLRLTREQADTLGGYLYARIGRIPGGGEQIRVDDWLLTVAEVTGRQIRRVRAQRLPLTNEHLAENNNGT